MLHAAQARREHDWEMQSWLAAWLTNLKLKKGAKPVQPRDINPLLQKPKKKVATGTIISQLMPVAVVKQWEELAGLKAKAIETGDWTEFRKRAKELQC